MVKTSHGQVAGLVSQRDGVAKWDGLAKIDIVLTGDLEWCFFQFECRGDRALASSQCHEIASAHDHCDSDDVEHHAQFKLEGVDFGLIDDQVNGGMGCCCVVRRGGRLGSLPWSDQMATVSSVKATITRSVVGSSVPSS
jgi:hypothetical protein